MNIKVIISFAFRISSLIIVAPAITPTIHTKQSLRALDLRTLVMNGRVEKGNAKQKGKLLKKKQN